MPEVGKGEWEVIDIQEVSIALKGLWSQQVTNDRNIMKSRKEQILAAVIKEYSDSALPVSSMQLFEKYNFECSPATLRNDMVVLEEEGYLAQPHTSAGRVPTDKGYRYFVDTLMKDRVLDVEAQKKMQHEILHLRTQRAKLSRMLAKMISGMSHSFALAGFEGEKDDFFEAGVQELLREPEFGKEENIKYLTNVLDNIDKGISKLSKSKSSKGVELYIGEENKYLPVGDCSLLVAKYQLPSGEKGFIALLGSKRMQYEKNISLLEYLVKILSGTLVLVLITNII